MIDGERTGVDDVRLAQHGSPEERPHAREQLEVHVTRHDVVRAALERPDAGDGVRARVGQNDHRHVPVPSPSGLPCTQPAAEVGLAGDHEVRRESLGEIERAGRPGRAEDREPVLAQLVLQKLPRPRLVLGEEDGAGAHPRRR
jgi:hypothetical protein